MSSRERELQCVVAGSFKFKPEIDIKIEELVDHGVVVLAPEKGWLYVPRRRILRVEEQGFRPLPGEKGMSVRQIEDEFLWCLAKSDFVYVVNPAGYVGQVVAMEVGVALALSVPVFAQEEIGVDLDADPAWKERVAGVAVKTVADIVAELGSEDV